MLARSHRLTSSREFAETIRRGRRAGTATMVVHLGAGGHAVANGDVPGTGEPAPRVGLVVGRTVGNAVIRNQVKRRLRHLSRAQLDALPAGARLVIRALPPAAAASSAELRSDIDSALGRLQGRHR